MGLSVRKSWEGGYTHASGALTAAERWNQSGTPSGLFSLDDGTGAGQANQVFVANFSIAATTMQLYDLKSGNGELDVLNVALAMTAVKLVEIKITTPAAATSLRFGPQNQTNAALLWFQAATANFYQEVLDIMVKGDARVGWALDATHKVIALYNPGAAAVAGRLQVTGTK